MTTRPNQLRADPYRAQLSRTFDAMLARRPEWAAEARQAKHRAEFEAVWARLGYPNDPALKARTFASLAPDFAHWDARQALALDLSRAAHQRRMEAASALGSRQGRALALQEHAQALMAALDRRITADRERRARLRPAGPIRVW